MPLHPKFPINWTMESFSFQMFFKVLLKDCHLGTHSSQTHRCLLLLSQQAMIDSYFLTSFKV